VQAFRTTVGERFPTDTLLSHDLIEGAHVGVALASDIELFENLPLTYASYCQRQHRWIRGDWQIAPWILPRVPAPGGQSERNPLTLVNRWRILDNLRRSLVPAASLLLLLFGWLISAAPGAWSLVVGLAIVIPGFAPLLDRLARHIQGSVRGWHGAADELVRAVVMIAFLPHQAWLSVDAIARVVYRRFVSRRHLLQWQTAESAARRRMATPALFPPLAHHLRSFCAADARPACGTRVSTHLGISGAVDRIPGPDAMARPAGSVAQAGPDQRRGQALPAPPGAPHLAVFRRSGERRDELAASGQFSTGAARRGRATNLADQYRTMADVGAGGRGLRLSHVIDFLNRCTQTMATLDRLERYEGHLLNWYNTGTLEPLTPRYVSTVDSGNLLAGLWVFERGCRDLLRAPLLSQSCLRGMADTLGVLREETGQDPSM
jgi:cyclic beta-1,2-glucan synthetase